MCLVQNSYFVQATDAIVKKVDPYLFTWTRKYFMQMLTQLYQGPSGSQFRFDVVSELA